MLIENAVSVLRVAGGSIILLTKWKDRKMLAAYQIEETTFSLTMDLNFDTRLPNTFQILLWKQLLTAGIKPQNGKYVEREKQTTK